MKRGFSLIEIAISITILAVLIVAIVPTVSRSFFGLRRSSYKLTAHKLAQERIEELQLLNVSYYDNGPADYTFFDGLYELPDVPWNDAIFHQLGNATMSGDEDYGDILLGLTVPEDEPFVNFSRNTTGSWDIDQDGDLTNEIADNLYGNLSRIQVNVTWDFNDDALPDDDPVIVTTLIGGVSSAAVSLWAKAYGDGSNDYLYSLQQTSDRGYALVGRANGFAAADPVGLMIKTFTDGTLDWAKTYGGAGGSSSLNSLEQIPGGDYILGGNTDSFGAGGNDFLLINADSSGNLNWARTYGGGGNDSLRILEQTSVGDYILGGYSNSFFGGGGADDFLLIEVESSGNLGWAKTYGGGANDQLTSLQQTSGGGYILGGLSFSFDPAGDYLLIKTDSSGNLTWAKTYGGLGDDTLTCLEQTSDGGYILGGYTFSFGAGGQDCFLIKTLPDGTLDWAKTYGTPSNEYFGSLQQTSDGGYVLGGYSGVADIDYFTIKTDSLGNVDWSKTYGNGSVEGINKLQQTSDGGYILGGNTVSFGAGNLDYFLVKTDSAGLSCIGQDIFIAINNVAPGASDVTPVVNNVVPGVLNVAPTINNVIPTVTEVCP